MCELEKSYCTRALLQQDAARELREFLVCEKSNEKGIKQVFSRFVLARVLKGIASSMLSARLKKALSFRGVELYLRMSQVLPEVVGKQRVDVPDVQLQERRTGQPIVFPVKK